MPPPQSPHFKRPLSSLFCSDVVAPTRRVSLFNRLSSSPEVIIDNAKMRNLPCHPLALRVGAGYSLRRFRVSYKTLPIIGYLPDVKVVVEHSVTACQLPLIVDASIDLRAGSRCPHDLVSRLSAEVSSPLQIPRIIAACSGLISRSPVATDPLIEIRANSALQAAPGMPRSRNSRVYQHSLM